mmetsp:Transcript_9710/g.17067  ORF Transcript_9710/g.17067 Transcript_9710/m.17067 type:complete len:511 (+) Transcript_9710:37-1569(+)
MKLPLFFLCVAALISWSHQLQLGAETRKRPRWAAMVINLQRRTDRLRHFSAALHEKESWLSANNNTCRIPGRDGHQLEPARGASAWDDLVKPWQHGHIFGQLEQSSRPRPLDERKLHLAWPDINQAANSARANLDRRRPTPKHIRPISKPMAGAAKSLKLTPKTAPMKSKAHSTSSRELGHVWDDLDSAAMAALESQRKQLLSQARMENRHEQRLTPAHTKDTAALPAKHAAGLVVPTELTDRRTIVGSGWTTDKTLLTAFQHMNEAQWPTMTYGGIGLYLGHAAAWQHVVDKQLDYGLIFEDDLTMFAPNFEKDVSEILNGRVKSDIDWDFLYLQRCDDMDWEKERSWWGRGRKAMRRTATKSVAVEIDNHETVTCTGAYVVTLSGAKKLLNGAFPATIQLDYALGYIPGLRRAALSPPVAQCQEVVKNMFGDKVRDTDVQTSLAQKGDNDDHHAVSARKQYNDALAAEAMSTPSADFDKLSGEFANLRGHHKESLVEKHGLDIPDCAL